MRTKTLTAERLRQIMDYDPETGAFTRRARPNVGAGAAGCRHWTGYIFIGVDGATHLAHRLAWLYMTGEHPANDVEHRDLDKTNNRFANLRPCNDRLNQANTRTSKRNTSGYKGVSWNKNLAKWQAGIRRAGGGSLHLGLFACPVAAHLAYVVAADKAYGEYARAA